MSKIIQEHLPHEERLRVTTEPREWHTRNTNTTKPRIAGDMVVNPGAPGHQEEKTEGAIPIVIEKDIALHPAREAAVAHHIMGDLQIEM